MEEANLKGQKMSDFDDEFIRVFWKYVKPSTKEALLILGFDPTPRKKIINDK